MLFGVLGPVAVWTADGDPVPVPGRKVRALLAALLVHEGRAVGADRLVDDLWGEELPANPAGSLSGKVSQLRRALAAAQPGARRLVASPPPGYRLLLDADALDAHRFRALTARARGTADPRSRAALLSDALALWRGPAFADFAGEPSVQVAAARLDEERVTALEDHAEARLGAGEHRELVAELAELVAAHPLRERLHGLHMRALHLSGRSPEALANYAAVRARLVAELGVDPGPDLAALHRAILAGNPAPDPAPPSRPRSNLPAPITDLVGRDEDVRGVRARLASARLVTLTGPGGVGKTRLAVAAAEGLVDGFDDGVRLAELGSLSPGSAGGAAKVVSAALDVRDVAGVPPAQRLADALRTRQLLLVLDNCEHVVDEVAELAARLLRAAPRLRILATSREPLGLRGEVVCGVAPLEVPAALAAADPAALAQVPAVQLFVARASAAAPDFVLDRGTAEAVAALCRRLDGLPLALELAATRVRALGVHQLVDRLDDRFRLLAAGHRDAPARQRTLHAVIGWSWELLTGPERIVLRRLAVHADGCTLEAAEQVSAADDTEGGVDVAGVLVRLVDRSLVAVVPGADGPRYRLLESVAAYCLDRLADAAETERVRDRHGRYYAQLAERAEQGLYGPDQRRWLHRLDAETANLRGALDRATAGGDGELALRLVVALTWYWFLRGRLVEAADRLGAATELDAAGFDTAAPAALRARAAAWRAGVRLLLGERPDPATVPLWEQLDDPAARGRAEWFVAHAEIDFGDVLAVEKRLDRALAACEDAGDRWGVAAVLSTRARIGHVVDDLAAIERDGERSAALFRDLGERWGQLQASARLGGLAEERGDYDQASRLLRDGLRMAEELGLWPDVAARLAGLAWIAVQQQDYDQACDLAQRAHRLADEQGYRIVATLAEICLAFASRRRGDLDRAAQHLTGLLQAAGPRPPGAPPPLHLSLVLTELGFLAEQRGRWAEARRRHLDAFAAARALGDRGVAIALEGLAGAARRHRTSARLLGAADAVRRAISVPAGPAERVEIDRIAARARRALGEPTFTAAYAHGATLVPEEAAALA
ncbi:BTAD domain-containing putative transcriptional regulator [Pseudonocardia humida]|uniref:Winged helix-turn-helix domain-containing protein n=1 Tax=Pseudonocardia humida TaxID=2800819 RepID=A0ABT1ABW5_9PSEU|nr:BTAD domain-containing putative transcriptional regulator [Pseudonocardia humida]MCO1660556.1 winged helix-turn-helix domain-containing protein [Pseudonocardia humida]